jgi:hypothetical protein
MDVAMSPAARFLVFLALLLAGSTLSAAAPEVILRETSPELPAELLPRNPLYFRLGYTSDAPVRLRVIGYFGGAPAAAAHSNPAPAYPAGTGDAIAWFSLPEGSEVDEVRVVLLDANWQELAVQRFPVRARWATGSAAAPDAAWVTALNEAQQAIGLAHQAPPEPTPWLDAGLTLIFWTVPGSIVLQILALVRLRGIRCRLAWLVLFLVSPVYGFCITALIMGSNLWPIWLIVVSPFAFVILAALYWWPRAAALDESTVQT